MSPTLAELFALVIIFIAVVWLGIAMLPLIARFIYRTREQVRQSSEEAARELRGKGFREKQNDAQGGIDNNGKKQQG